jgi:cell division protein FtsB
LEGQVTIHIMSRTVNRKTITSIISVAVLFCFTGTALGDQYDDQINALKQQAVTQQQQAASAQAQATTYQQKVAQLQSQMSAMQTQINLSQLRFDQVSQSITDNEAKLAVQKKVLAANIEAMYLASTVTPLEMLASSKSFSDFFDQQEYQDKVKDGVQNAMGQVQTLQAQLEGQKKQVTELLINQEGQQQQLASTQSQVNQLPPTSRSRPTTPKLRHYRPNKPLLLPQLHAELKSPVRPADPAGPVITAQVMVDTLWSGVMPKKTPLSTRGVCITANVSVMLPGKLRKMVSTFLTGAAAVMPTSGQVTRNLPEFL